MNFEQVEKIAAAILYEGYLLYPYRPTAVKNRQRWNFGTLYPRVYAEAQRPAEPFRFVAECLAVADSCATLDVRLRFLQLVRGARSLPPLTDPSLSWDQAVERTSEHANLRLDSLVASPLSLLVEMDAGLAISLLISAQELDDGSCKLHLEVLNISPLCGGAGSNRDQALPFSLVSAHLLLGLTGGELVSLLDPEEKFRASVNLCSSIGVFPVLAGEGRSTMLCSPIILYDYPQIAPESAGDFFDGTEMDEMLTLRVLTLTDAEKQEMRNGDPRARKILERTEALSEEDMLKVHGVIRELRTLRGAS
jgi:hypothetical protein